MRTRNILQYSLRFKKFPFIIQTIKMNQYANFTFLESNIFELPKYISENNCNIQSLSRYSKIIDSYRYSVGRIVNKQIQDDNLSDAIVKQIQKPFLAVKQQIKRALIAKKTTKQILQLGQLAFSLNIIDHQIWNRILAFGSLYYAQMNLNYRLRFSILTLKYFSKYNYIYPKLPTHFKFVLRESSLSDLIDFEHYFMMTQQKQFFNSQLGAQFGNRLDLLLTKMKIIEKVKKSVDINFFELRQAYKTIESQILQNLNFMSLKDLVNVYYFYSSIAANSSTLSVAFQKQISQKLKSQNDSIKVTEINSIMKKLSQIWRNQGKYNQIIYQQFFLPKIKNMVEWTNESDQNSLTISKFQLYKHTLYNLLGAGIPITQQIRQLAQILFSCDKKDDKTLHIIGHILKIRDNKPQKNSMTIGQIAQCRKFMNNNSTKQSISYNNVQRFWYQIIRSVVDSQNILKSKYICVYEIDMLIKYKGQTFAFQIVGSHYANKQDKTGNVNKSGKKKIKQQILKRFRIQTVQLFCSNPQAKIIMRFNDKQRGKFFIEKLLEQAYNKGKKQQESVERFP